MQVQQAPQDLVLVEQEELLVDQMAVLDQQGHQGLQEVQEVQEVQVVMDRQGHKATVCLAILILLGKVRVLVMELLDKLIYKRKI